jgi:hypothetical protein
MRIVINIVLFLVTIFLVYLLYSSIQEPIKFKRERTRREDAVIARLMQIRAAQEAYRDITGGFAANFDTLQHVLRTGKFKIIKVVGDPDDPNFTGEISYDTVYQPAIEYVQNLGIEVDSLPFVPFTGRKVQFDMDADTLTYQSTLVQVVEVKTQRKLFMGPIFSDPSFSKYDKSYDPGSYLKFGSMSQPNLSGNWEGR